MIEPPGRIPIGEWKYLMDLPCRGPNVNLADVDPVLLWRAARMAEILPGIRIVSGARTYEQQKALWDGFKAGADGYHLAADPDLVNPTTGRRGSSHQVQTTENWPHPVAGAIDWDRGPHSWSEVHRVGRLFGVRFPLANMGELSEPWHCEVWRQGSINDYVDCAHGMPAWWDGDLLDQAVPDPDDDHAIVRMAKDSNPYAPNTSEHIAYAMAYHAAIRNLMDGRAPAEYDEEGPESLGTDTAVDDWEDKRVVPAPKPPDYRDRIKPIQHALGGLAVDGIIGPLTRARVREVEDALAEYDCLPKEIRGEQ